MWNIGEIKYKIYIKNYIEENYNLQTHSIKFLVCKFAFEVSNIDTIALFIPLTCPIHRQEGEGVHRWSHHQGAKTRNESEAQLSLYINVVG